MAKSLSFGDCHFRACSVIDPCANSETTGKQKDQLSLAVERSRIANGRAQAVEIWTVTNASIASSNSAVQAIRTKAAKMRKWNSLMKRRGGQNYLRQT
jgi:hypothetical protein